MRILSRKRCLSCPARFVLKVILTGGYKATNDLTYVWWALGLLVLAGVPILPGVFNPLVRRLSGRFTAGQPLPRLPAVARVQEFANAHQMDLSETRVVPH